MVMMKIWLAQNVNKDTNIKLFNVYVKSVLLYGCQTWLVTCEIFEKASVLCKQMLAIYHEDLVVQGYI
jgi:hypothetical protein